MSNAAVYKLKLLHSENLVKDYYLFDFTKPEGFTFVNGQFGVFGLIGEEVEGRKLRAFSIASTNEESFIRIATRILPAPSDFKQKLLDMKLGGEVSMNAPLGDFSLNEAYGAVFIAGGIGITPIRSMLLSKQRSQSSRNDTLIFSELDGNYPFKSEVEKLVDLDILYAADVEPTQSVIIQTALKHKNDVFYYLSGSPGFVNGIKALLEQNGIVKEQIKFDAFIGY